MNLSSKKHLPYAFVCASALTLAACGSDSDGPSVTVAQPTPAPVEPVMETYQVTVTNATNSQPLSPLTLVLHTEGYLWQLGMTASVELEQMAEGGDNTGLLAMGDQSVGGAGIVMPGASETLEFEIEEGHSTKMTLATMLVNTNDAFVGLNALSLPDLAVGDTVMLQGMVWDAGTEANSEMAGTMPGPADGGTGYDAVRDDVDFVAMHPGVVSSDDGLSQSVLSAYHRFDNPAIKVTLTRVD